MSTYHAKPLELDLARTYPLRSRKSKVSVKDFARTLGAGVPLPEGVDSLAGKARALTIGGKFRYGSIMLPFWKAEDQ